MNEKTNKVYSIADLSTAEAKSELVEVLSNGGTAYIIFETQKDRLKFEETALENKFLDRRVKGVMIGLGVALLIAGGPIVAGASILSGLLLADATAPSPQKLAKLCRKVAEGCNGSIRAQWLDPQNPFNEVIDDRFTSDTTSMVYVYTPEFYHRRMNEEDDE